MKRLTITIVPDVKLSVVRGKYSNPEHCQLSVEEGKISGRWVGRRSKVMSTRVENGMY